MSEYLIDPEARQGPSLEPAAAPRTSRRAFLVGTGAVVLSGMVGSRLGADAALAHDAGAEGGDPSLDIWAATKASDRYLSLSGTAHAPEMRELRIEDDGSVSVGESLGISFPKGFVPVALHAMGDRLLAAGATVPEGDSAVNQRPALYEVAAGAARELPLSDAVSVEFGVATAVAHTSQRHLAVVVEGSDDAEMACNDNTRVAESADGGVSWTVSDVASALGEGEQSHLAAFGTQLFVATVDGWGTRRFHQRVVPGGGWDEVPANAGEGPVLAVVAADRRAVDVIDRSADESVRRLRWDRDGRDWEDAGRVDIGEGVVEVLAISGTRELIAMGQSDTRLVS